MKPTDEQVKEFWEWCGFKLAGIPDFPDDEFPTTIYWVTPDGFPTDIPFKFPDLNNLFKYVVPKAYPVKITIDYTKELFECEIKCFQHRYIGKGETEALALFWAIYEVIK